MKSLVSIVIPTANRAGLLGATLDSILKQTYYEWEAIIVDDHSFDHTEKLMEFYLHLDSRINFYKLPQGSAGANACRNMGMKLAKGEFINWFDSDDIMEPEFINKKLEFLIKSKLDFVVSKTVFFHGSPQNIKRIKYKNVNKQITLSSFATGEHTWVTPDGMLRRRTLQNVQWNENLFSGQEFNFIVKYLSTQPRGNYINLELTKARVHGNSIHSTQKLHDTLRNKYKVYFLTYKELNNEPSLRTLEKKITSNHLLRLSMSFAFKLAKEKIIPPEVGQLLSSTSKNYGYLKTIIFFFSLVTAFFIKKGYILMDFSRRNPTCLTMNNKPI